MKNKRTYHTAKRTYPFSLIWILLFITITMPNAGIAQEASVSDERLTGLDEQLERIMESFQGTGIAVAIVEHDEIIYSRGFGYRDVENRLPVTPNTVFAIGSIGKAFTTASMGILREEGLLDFSDSPLDHIPELRFYNAEMNERITLSDMMSHRTGLPRHDMVLYAFPIASRDSLIQKFRYLEPAANIREKFLYNNLMYELQGIILERKTGTFWGESFKQTLFEPLEMHNTVTSISELVKQDEPAFGYELIDQSEISRMDYLDCLGVGTAGFIYSNVIDMSNWLMAWMNKGTFNGEQVIPSSFVSEAISSQMVMGAGLPSLAIPDRFFSTYGYGWMLNSYKGKYHVRHGGYIDGFSAMTGFFPSEKIGIIVLENRFLSPIHDLAYNVIADRMLESQSTDWEELLKGLVENSRGQEERTLEEVTNNQKRGTSPHHPLEDYAGEYRHPGYGTYRVSIKDDSLRLRSTRHDWLLKHYHHDVFIAHDVESGRAINFGIPWIVFYVNFLTNNQGDISSFLINLHLEQEMEPLEFRRIGD